MVMLAASALFAWGAVAAGYGVYAVSAALTSHSTFHATQAGVALLIATVSFSAGVLVMVLGRLSRVLRPPENKPEHPGADDRETAS